MNTTNNREKPDIFDRFMSIKFLKPINPFYQRFKEQILYLLFGVLTTAVNLAVFWFLVNPLGMNHLAANIIAWIAGVAFAYITNRTWVFADKAYEAKGVIREVVSFTLGRLATLGLEELLLWLGIDILKINTLLVKVIATVLVVIGNYIVSKLIVFRKKNKH